MAISSSKLNPFDDDDDVVFVVVERVLVATVDPVMVESIGCRSTSAIAVVPVVVVLACTR